MKTTDHNFSRTITLAVTGASGAQYALRLIEQLIKANCQILLMISRAAEVVIATETGMGLPSTAKGSTVDDQQIFLNQYFAARDFQIRLFGRDDWFSPVASGSSKPSSMVICPASGGTLSAIAHGASNNLIERAADVALKERRQLIIVPRETPYSQVHLENMLKLTQMGAMILPASPGFYNAPHSVDDLINFVVARVLDQLSVQQELVSCWGS